MFNVNGILILRLFNNQWSLSCPFIDNYIRYMLTWHEIINPYPAGTEGD